MNVASKEAESPTPRTQTYSSALWDLSNGNLRSTGPLAIELGRFSGIAWVAPQKLFLGFSRSVVYDISRDLVVIVYDSGNNNIVSKVDKKLLRSVDGRVWKNLSRSGYGLSPTTSGQGPIEQEIIKKDALFNFENTPVQLVMNLGDQRTNQRFAGQYLQALQEKGWQIGPSKYSWYITAGIGTSNENVMDKYGTQISLPAIDYRWTLIENGKGIITSTFSHTYFIIKESRYYTGDEKYPLILPIDKPVRVMIDELLAKRKGMADCSLDARETWLPGADGPVLIPAHSNFDNTEDFFMR